MQKLKFKKLHPKAKLPTRGTASAAGYDLYLAENESINYHPRLVKFGIAVEIPEGYCGLLVERSSNWKHDFQQENKIGIIDSDYRGELMVPISGDVATLKAGTRIAQLVIVPILTLDPEWSDELSDSERGEGAFGSTG